MDYADLSPDEQILVGRFRGLSDSRKKAVTASESSFIDWLKTSVSEVWNKVSSFAKDLWRMFRDLF